MLAFVPPKNRRAYETGRRKSERARRDRSLFLGGGGDCFFSVYVACTVPFSNPTKSERRDLSPLAAAHTRDGPTLLHHAGRGTASTVSSVRYRRHARTLRTPNSLRSLFVVSVSSSNMAVVAAS